MTYLDNRGLFAMPADTRIMVAPQQPFTPDPPPRMEHDMSYAGFPMQRIPPSPQQLRTAGQERRAEMHARIEGALATLPRSSDTPMNGDTLYTVMAKGWFSSWRWRRKTNRLKRDTFFLRRVVRIKDDAPICWKGRSGYITENNAYSVYTDLVTVQLYGGVVGTPDWTTLVSLYDLIPMTTHEGETEEAAWRARIHQLGQQQAEQRDAAARAEIRARQSNVAAVRAAVAEPEVIIVPVSHPPKRRLII